MQRAPTSPVRPLARTHGETHPDNLQAESGGYAEGVSLHLWHFALGALVALLAVLELAQDWKRG